MVHVRRINVGGMTARGIAAPHFRVPDQARRLGQAQELAAYQARESNQPMPLWKRYPVPVEQMPAADQDSTFAVVDNWSSHNQLRKVGAFTYWWLRAPGGMLPNEPGFNEIPADMPVQPLAAPTTAEIAAEERDQLAQALLAAYDAGRLQCGSHEWEIAARVHTALISGKPTQEALMVHLAGGNRTEAHRKVVILAQVVPEVEPLTKVI